MAKLESVSRRLFAGRLRTVRLSARYTPALQAVPSFGQIGMLALGGWMAARGQITLGTFVAFSTYLAQLTGPVPIPARTQDGLDRLRALLNVSDSGFRLFVAWLVAALFPDIAHPILAISGEQGTAKST